MDIASDSSLINRNHPLFKYFMEIAAEHEDTGKGVVFRGFHVTPDIANYVLKFRGNSSDQFGEWHQRNVRQGHVASLVEEFERDLWDHDAEMPGNRFIFGPDLSSKDGQHRLEAVSTFAQANPEVGPKDPVIRDAVFYVKGNRDAHLLVGNDLGRTAIDMAKMSSDKTVREGANTQLLAAVSLYYKQLKNSKRIARVVHANQQEEFPWWDDLRSIQASQKRRITAAWLAVAALTFDLNKKLADELWLPLFSEDLEQLMDPGKVQYHRFWTRVYSLFCEHCSGTGEMGKKKALWYAIQIWNSWLSLQATGKYSMRSIRQFPKKRPDGKWPKYNMPTLDKPVIGTV